MAHTYWPLFDLRIRTPRLELRCPDDDDLVALATLAAQGVHPPDFMPFTTPWTTAPAGELERNMLQYHWRLRAELTPEQWDLAFVTVVDGEVVGSQGIGAKNFGVRRAFGTGSWLGRAHHGRGIGKEMRAAVLHFAFDGLGAVLAESSAFEDNAPSIAVSRALGYEDNGYGLSVRQGRADREIRFVMSRARWEERRRDDIVIEGLAPCLPLLVGEGP